MRRLAPYQTGLWLAEYLSVRCQLCRVYRSAAPSQRLATVANSLGSNSLGSNSLGSNSLNTSSLNSNALAAKPSSFAKVRRKLSHRFRGGLLCSHCHNSIAWLPKPFYVDSAAGTTLPIQAATYYDYPIRQAIRAFKHHEDMTKLPLLLHALRQLPRPYGCHYGNSVIVAMPTTNQRLIKRGFDPVSILSAQLSKHWQIPLWQGVERIDDTVSQQGLTRAERLGNLNDAFALTTKPPVKRLLLFDDVATTGASLQALALAFDSHATIVTGIHPQNPSGYDLSAYALAHGSQ